MNLHRSGRLQEAEAGYRECLRNGDAGAGAPLAALLLQVQRDDEVIELLEPLALAAPDNAEIAVNLSVALRRSGRVDEALAQARRACAQAKPTIAAWNAFGLAALDLGRADDALAALESGLRLAPDNRALQLHRAHALRRLGRYRDALPAYESVVRADPNRIDGWRGLADAQAALGDNAAALRGRERALALAPDDPEAAFEHAVALLQAGRADDAVRRLESAVAARPDHAQAWAWLGRARLRAGDMVAARTAFDQARSRDADDPVIAHFHAALSGDLPTVVENAYIEALFDDFADRFEHTLVDRLGYDAPAQLARFLRRHRADGATSVLDLGCGTGLLGKELARAGRSIDGVDLSPRMLAQAREKGLYRELHAAELVAFLRGSGAHWDLIAATDVFIYVAELRPVFAAVFDRLEPGGAFAFSLESSASGDTELVATTGRYRHSRERVVRELGEAGFSGVEHESIVLRQETGHPVAGDLVLARR